MALSLWRWPMADILKEYGKVLTKVSDSLLMRYDFNPDLFAALVHKESFHVRKAFHLLCSAYLRQLAGDWIEGKLNGTEMEDTGRRTYQMLYGEQ